MKIVRLNRGNLADINTPNEPFAIIGRLKPSFTDGKWSWTEELYDRTVLKRYPNDDCDYAAYLDNPDKAIFLAYADGKCAGQIVLRKDWNRYAFVEDLCVAAQHRRYLRIRQLPGERHRDDPDPEGRPMGERKGTLRSGAGDTGQQPAGLPVLREVRLFGRRREYDAL